MVQTLPNPKSNLIQKNDMKTRGKQRNLGQTKKTADVKSIKLEPRGWVSGWVDGWGGYISMKEGYLHQIQFRVPTKARKICINRSLNSVKPRKLSEKTRLGTDEMTIKSRVQSSLSLSLCFSFLSSDSPFPSVRFQPPVLFRWPFLGRGPFLF